MDYNSNMNQTKSQDILAKLLSNENITVTRGRVRTASFDIKNRVLTLPRWKDMTPTIEEMLMLHEVGHALYTGASAYGVVFNEKKHLKDYANVIEDVRIEKKMKDRYPGSRKSFNIGYKELNERDFFEVKGRDTSKMLLIDRINLYFKVGYSSGIQFSSLEQDLIRRIDLCETEEDVIKLAQEIYDFSKNEKAEEMFGDSQVDPEDIDWDNVQFEETDEEQDNSQVDENAPAQESNKLPKAPPQLTQEQEQVVEKALEAKTTKALEYNIDNLADENTEHFYFDLKFEYETKDVIIPYKKIYSELKELTPEDFLQYRRDKFNKFKADSAPMINYLIKEFEMRKSATAYKRTKISRIGQLDPRKLYAYKIKEDLFKQIATVQDGKKHGMIFLLDWSGSMSSYIDETIQQVVNLAMFCQRSQIPYQVFAFTDGYNYDNRYMRMNSNDYNGVKPVNPNGMDSQLNFNLLELFSNKMSSAEFNKQLELMMAMPYKRKGYKLNGTPLNQALLYMVDYAGIFKRDNQVEKLSFITLTDGESNNLSATRRIINGDTYDYDPITGRSRRVNGRSFVRDHITKKEYALSCEQGEQTSMLLNVIRDRYDATSIGFYIMDPKGRNANTFIRHNYHGLKNGQAYTLREKIATSLKKDHHVILKDVPGRDEYYLIPSDQQIEEFSLDKIDVTDSAAAIARELTKNMNARKQSRIVLNSFIGQVA